ncbi:MAG: amidohydrolase family protein [Gemmatimonas sp.]|nr:amidohydrolase family protein [Gemmatimonas sp.]
MTLRPTPKLAGAVGVLSLVVALGFVYVRSPDSRATRPAATPTPTPSSTDVGSTERESIPVPCRELLAGPPPSLRDHKPMVFTDATVLTMDAEGNRAGSVSIKDGKIVSTSKEAGQAIDLEGATVMPGFIDSHSHRIGDKDLVGLTAQQAIYKALSWGWTSISELFVSFERLGELCELELSGDLRVKVGAFLPLNYERQRFGNWYDDYEPGEEFGTHVWVQGLKFFADRAQDGLGYQTDPPSPSVQGKLFWKPRGLGAAFRRASEAGWQIAIHATGDGGLDLALDAFSTLGRKDIIEARHRVEHLTIVRGDQIKRLRRLGLIGSIQLSWFHAGAAKDLIRWVGRDRVGLTGRWRDLIDAGIPITGSTDSPWAIVGRSGPSIPAIAEAVTRISPRGKAPPRWMRSQRLTVEEALRSLTIDAAFAQGKEESLGSIEAGKVADLVILSADPTQVAPEALWDITVVATIVDGRVEYCANSVPADLQKVCP